MVSAAEWVSHAFNAASVCPETSGRLTAEAACSRIMRGFQTQDWPLSCCKLGADDRATHAQSVLIRAAADTLPASQVAASASLSSISTNLTGHQTGFFDPLCIEVPALVIRGLWGIWKKDSGKKKPPKWSSVLTESHIYLVWWKQNWVPVVSPLHTVVHICHFVRDALQFSSSFIKYFNIFLICKLMKNKLLHFLRCQIRFISIFLLLILVFAIKSVFILSQTC